MTRFRYATKGLMVAVTLCALSGLSVAQVPKGNETKLTPEQVSKVKLAIASPKGFSVWAITSQEFTGDFASVKQHLDDFQAELKQQAGVTKGIKETHPAALLVLLEDPTGKGEFRMKVGCEVAEKVSPKSPLSVEHLKYSQAVRYLHTGRYEDLADLHAGIKANLKTNNKASTWPVTLRLLDDPARVGQDKVRTELVIPVG